jgi:hypothetical protein
VSECSEVRTCYEKQNSALYSLCFRLSVSAHVPIYDLRNTLCYHGYYSNVPIFITVSVMGDRIGECDLLPKIRSRSENVTDNPSVCSENETFVVTCVLSLLLAEIRREDRRTVTVNNVEILLHIRPPLWSSGQEFLATQRRCIVFPVRYELNLCMLCRRK